MGAQANDCTRKQFSRTGARQDSQDEHHIMQTVVCICNDPAGMSDDEPIAISITLSPTQVDAVVRAATNSRAPSARSADRQLVEGAARRRQQADGTTAAGRRGPGARSAGRYMPTTRADSRLSRSLLRGLSLLTCFGPEGGERGIVELAADLGMSPSTAHRYALHARRAGPARALPEVAQVPAARHGQLSVRARKPTRGPTRAARIGADPSGPGAVRNTNGRHRHEPRADAGRPAPSVGMA